MVMGVQLQTTYSTPVSNSSFLPLLLLSLSTQKHSPRTTSLIKDEYDYIVVGGGASGSVVASRLSEIPCVSVLLLEAGPEPPLLTEVPALGLNLLGTDVDWKFKTVPQKYAASGIKNREMPYSFGKMLGGSSSHNTMAYVRGNRKDFDNWVKMGARGWSYNEIFRYFLKLENNRTPAYLANGYHAVGGPITYEQPNYRPLLKQALLDAAIRLGYRFVDPNGAHQTGLYDIQANLRNNQRCSPVKGYLVPADNRNNLDISINSFVTRVIIKDNQAIGVEMFNGMRRQIKARKEIIITAGTVNTPKLLMLSGVGPKEELNKHCIPVVVDLPVGKNFHDHSAVYYYYTLDPRFRKLEDKLSDPANINRYITSRSGPLASPTNLIIAFIDGLNITSTSDYPNNEVYFGEFDNSLKKGLGLKQDIYNQYFGPYEDRALFPCISSNLHPRSRGTVTLNSSNPFDPPLIDPNFLEDPRDVQDLVDGLKFCKKLLETQPMVSLGAKPLQTLMPGCRKYADDEDGYFRCYARTFLVTFGHPVGTSTMGNPSDPTTVVDPELRVKGIKGLRVADASVMPRVPSGNTQTPVLMVAEKASDMIKSTISCSKFNKM